MKQHDALCSVVDTLPYALRPVVIAIWLCVAVATAGAQSTPVDYRSLYDQHRWFELRDVIAREKAPEFYHAVVATAFGDPQAEKLLQAVVDKAPHSRDAIEARDLLINIALRSGRYRQALQQINAALALDPKEAGMENAKAIFTPLAQFSDMQVIDRGTADLQFRMEDGNLFVPVTIEGRTAYYLVDTGANFSMISEREARRLDMVVTGAAQGSDATGGKQGFRVALARNLGIGGLGLANVAFLVVPDNSMPFRTEAADHQGILGLPVLLALRTMRWYKNGTFTAGSPGAEWNPARANLCFDNADIVARADVQGVDIRLQIDTGATHSRLWPTFAREFPEVMRAVRKSKSTKVTGTGNSAKVRSAILPEVGMRLGETDVRLHPATVLLENTVDLSRHDHGTIGLDLLLGRTVTFDFESMRLVIE
jgi:predicted aspartyl protease